MPFNLLKTYNQLLELAFLPEHKRRESLYAIFKRDIIDNENFNFRDKKLFPVKANEPEMETLFTHLTGVIVDKKTRKREFEMKRCERLHWIKFLIEERKVDNVLVFSVEDGDGIRTYIFDVDESYVIVLAPKKPSEENAEYYLLTAYKLEGRNVEKINNKYARRLPVIY